jgi:hypothetical protein
MLDLPLEKREARYGDMNVKGLDTLQSATSAEGIKSHLTKLHQLMSQPNGVS